jgi:ABC-type proline/glycine betaine transport system ATPase subunit
LTESEIGDLPNVLKVKSNLSDNTIEVEGNFGGKTDEQIAEELTKPLKDHGYAVSVEKQIKETKWSDFKIALPIALVFIFGFVFQDFALFPWLTVYQNIEFGLKMEGKAVNERKKTTLKYAEFMGLEKFLESYPHELSGGMRQRVGIARALAINPEIVFLDEPFSALDSFTAQKLRKELLELWKKHGITFVMVTHLVEEAVQLGTRIAVFSQRPGTIEKVFDNSLPFPRNLRSEHFFALVDKITDQVAI